MLEMKKLRRMFSKVNKRFPGHTLVTTGLNKIYRDDCEGWNWFDLSLEDRIVSGRS